MNPKTVLKTDWSPFIEQAVRNAAAVCVFVYTAGLMFGTWLHETNDMLAGKTVRQVVKVEPKLDLSTLKMAELRTMARKAGISRSTYRYARKAQLVDLLS